MARRLSEILMSFPQYQGASPDFIKSNLTEVINSGDSQRIGSLTSALKSAPEYMDWNDDEIKNSVSQIIGAQPVPQQPVSTFKPEPTTELQKMSQEVKPAVKPEQPVNRSVFTTVNQFAPAIDSSSSNYGADPNLVRAIIAAESAGNTTAKSPKGAQGLMQIMPDTGKELGITDAFDPNQNIDGGTKYIVSLLKANNNDTAKALAAYNAGQAMVDKYNGVPPFPETQQYVKRVMKYYEELQKQPKATPATEQPAVEPVVPTSTGPAPDTGSVDAVTGAGASAAKKEPPQPSFSGSLAKPNAEETYKQINAEKDSIVSEANKVSANLTSQMKGLSGYTATLERVGKELMPLKEKVDNKTATNEDIDRYNTLATSYNMTYEAVKPAIETQKKLNELYDKAKALENNAEDVADKDTMGKIKAVTKTIAFDMANMSANVLTAVATVARKIPIGTPQSEVFEDESAVNKTIQAIKDKYKLDDYQIKSVEKSGLAGNAAIVGAEFLGLMAPFIGAGKVVAKGAEVARLTEAVGTLTEKYGPSVIEKVAPVVSKLVPKFAQETVMQAATRAISQHTMTSLLTQPVSFSLASGLMAEKGETGKAMTEAIPLGVAGVAAGAVAKSRPARALAQATGAVGTMAAQQAAKGEAVDWQGAILNGGLFGVMELFHASPHASEAVELYRRVKNSKNEVAARAALDELPPEIKAKAEQLLIAGPKLTAEGEGFTMREAPEGAAEVPQGPQKKVYNPKVGHEVLVPDIKAGTYLEPPKSTETKTTTTEDKVADASNKELESMDAAHKDNKADLEDLGPANSVDDILHRDKRVKEAMATESLTDKGKRMVKILLKKARDGVLKDKDGNGREGRVAADEAIDEGIANKDKFGDFSVVAIDVGNLGGENTRSGHIKANKHLEKIFQIIDEEAAKHPNAIFKVGGDEANPIIYAPKKIAQAIMDNASKRIDEYRAQEGLLDTPHPKHDGMPTGSMYVTYGVANTAELPKIKAALDKAGKLYDSDRSALLQHTDALAYEHARTVLDKTAKGEYIINKEKQTYERKNRATEKSGVDAGRAQQPKTGGVHKGGGGGAGKRQPTKAGTGTTAATTEVKSKAAKPAETPKSTQEQAHKFFQDMSHELASKTQGEFTAAEKAEAAGGKKAPTRLEHRAKNTEWVTKAAGGDEAAVKYLKDHGFTDERIAELQKYRATKDESGWTLLRKSEPRAPERNVSTLAADHDEFIATQKKLMPKTVGAIRVQSSSEYLDWGDSGELVTKTFGKNDHAALHISVDGKSATVFINYNRPAGEAVKTYIHEVVHYGDRLLRGKNAKLYDLLSKQFDADASRTPSGAETVKEWIKREYGKDGKPLEDGDPKIFQEWLAHTMEKYIDKSWTSRAEERTIKTVWESIKRMLGDVFKRTTGKMTDPEFAMREFVSKMKVAKPEDAVSGKAQSLKEISAAPQPTRDELIKQLRDKKITPQEFSKQYGKVKIAQKNATAVKVAPVAEPSVVKKVEPDLTKVYEGNRNVDGKKVKEKILPHITGMFGRNLAPISTQLRLIDPSLKNVFKQSQFGVERQKAEYKKEAKGFVEGVAKMNKGDWADLDLALKRRDYDIADAIIEKAGLTKEYDKVKDILDDLYNKAKDAGIDIDYAANYWPAKVLDYESYSNYLRGREDWSKIKEDAAKIWAKKEAGRPPTTDEEIDIINKLVRGFGADKIEMGKPGHAKERKIFDIDAEKNKFYMDSKTAVSEYIDSMTEALAARKFFGKDAEINAGVVDLDSSIGNYVARLIQDGTINYREEIILKDILRAYWRPGKIGKVASFFKDIEYIDTMGSPLTAVTQLQDYSWSISNAGIMNTLKALLSKKRVDIKDIGLDKISEEFTSPSKSSKAVNLVFKMTGLTKLDAMAKQTFVNSAMLKYEGMAKNDLGGLEKAMKQRGVENTAETIKSFKEGKVDDNTLYMVYADALNYYPIGKTEMPLNYLKAGNGKIMWMLKSYTIKQLDVFRNQYLDALESKGQGAATGTIIKNMTLKMAKTAGTLIALGMGTQAIKDWMSGRDTDLTDNFMTNLITITGLQKYYIYKARSEGAWKAAVNLVLPPFKLMESIARDAKTIASGKANPKDLEIWQSLPYGKLYYWNYGKGLKLTEKQHMMPENRKEAKDIMSDLNSVNDRLKQYAKDKDITGLKEFRREHKKELGYFVIDETGRTPISQYKSDIESYTKAIKAAKDRGKNQEYIDKLIKRMDKRAEEFVEMYDKIVK